MNLTLARWNLAEQPEAVREVLPCNGSLAWATQLAAQRPFAEPPALLHAADEVWASLGDADRQQAFDSHPRLGERHAQAATAQSLHWSAREQGNLGADADLGAQLAEANLVYEQQFGRIFLLCAAGKSAAEVLRELRRRLRNDPAAELREAAEQQRRITQLRLRRWLGLPPSRAEDV